jgi:hypothetical protein
MSLQTFAKLRTTTTPLHYTLSHKTQCIKKSEKKGLWNRIEHGQIHGYQFGMHLTILRVQEEQYLMDWDITT